MPAYATQSQSLFKKKKKKKSACLHKHPQPM